MDDRIGGGKFYRLARWVAWCGLKLLVGFESHGAENVPATGGCLIVANHVSYLDPPALGCGLQHRMVRFMARDTLMSSPLARWFFKHVNVVPLDRTRGDITALRRAIHVLKEGCVLGLFPEGTRSPDGTLQAAKGGVGFLIAKAGVPVVPAFIDGSYQALPKGAAWIRPGKVRIFYGPPIRPEEMVPPGSGRPDFDALGRLVMERIAALRPAELRALPPAS